MINLRWEATHGNIKDTSKYFKCGRIRSRIIKIKKGHAVHVKFYKTGALKYVAYCNGSRINLYYEMQREQIIDIQYKSFDSHKDKKVSVDLEIDGDILINLDLGNREVSFYDKRKVEFVSTKIEAGKRYVRFYSNGVIKAYWDWISESKDSNDLLVVSPLLLIKASAFVKN